jgi:hypothetical protein
VSKATLFGGLVLAIILSSAGNLVVSMIAHALGASTEFMALNATTFVPFVVVGVVLGAVGWNVVRRRAAKPAAVLRVLVPAVLVVSFAPDLILGGRLPGSSAGAVLALMVMHVVVTAVVVPTYLRVLPLPATGKATPAATG